MPNLPYDVTGPVGQVRFHAADTEVAVDLLGNLTDNTVFSDGEIGYCLALNDGNPVLAAAMLLQTAATDKARLAIISSRGSGNTDASRLSDTYAARADELRRLAAVAPSVDSPDAVFILDQDGVPGSMDCW